LAWKSICTPARRANSFANACQTQQAGIFSLQISLIAHGRDWLPSPDTPRLVRCD
jgi:hypothetical protein